MLLQIFVGSVLLILNIMTAAVAAMLLEVGLAKAHRWLLREPHRLKLVVLVVTVSVWLLGVVTASVWIWGFAYYGLGTFATVEESVYFSIVMFTTLGLGDVILPMEWRILSGMEAANGFITFSLLTALFIEALRQIRLSQIELRQRRD